VLWNPQLDFCCNSHNSVMEVVTMETLDALVEIALDLTAALDAADRYEWLIGALGRVIPYDAAALHRLEERPPTTQGDEPASSRSGTPSTA